MGPENKRGGVRDEHVDRSGRVADGNEQERRRIETGDAVRGRPAAFGIQRRSDLETVIRPGVRVNRHAATGVTLRPAKDRHGSQLHGPDLIVKEIVDHASGPCSPANAGSSAIRFQRFDRPGSDFPAVNGRMPAGSIGSQEGEALGPRLMEER